MGPGEVVQILVGFGALVAFLTGFSALRQRQRLEYLRDSVRSANERLEDLAERQDALPLPASAIDQELRPSSNDPLSWLVMGLSITAAAGVLYGYLLLVSEGLLSFAGALGWFASTAVLVIVVTALVGLIDLMWGLREKRLALLHYSARLVAAMMLRSVIMARLILIQQLHRSLSSRLSSSDQNFPEADRYTLGLIAGLPQLLTGAGVPRWRVKKAQRNALKQLGVKSHIFALRTTGPGEDLTHQASCADLVLRQFRPTPQMWSSLNNHADELRRRLPEWQWIDLLCAWTSIGMLPSSASPTLKSYDREFTARLEGLDHRRAIGINAEARDVDSRDFAAWTIANNLDVRKAALARLAAHSDAPWAETAWDVPVTTGELLSEMEAMPTGGFQSRDPIVWLALTQPSTTNPLDWVPDHFHVSDHGVTWRPRGSDACVATAGRDALARDRVRPEAARTELDGLLTGDVWRHPEWDSINIATMRFSGALDFAEVFRRYSTGDEEHQTKRPPLHKRIDVAIASFRLIPMFPRPAQAVIVLLLLVLVVLVSGIWS